MAAAYLIAVALGMSSPYFPALEAVDKACGSDLQCQADALVYMQAESGMKEDPTPFSRDAKSHISCGILQIPCRVVGKLTLTGQVVYWVRLRAWSQKVCERAGLPPEARMAALASGNCDRGRELAKDRYESREAALFGLQYGLR